MPHTLAPRPLLWLSALVGLALVAPRPASGGVLTERFARLRLIRPLDRPGQALRDAVAFTRRDKVPMKVGECWHFQGKSRLTGEPLVGVEQRWLLPAGTSLSPSQVVDLMWRGGTVGADGEGPRFALLKRFGAGAWSRATAGESPMARGFQGALVRIDNMRPASLSSIYNKMGGHLILDGDRVVKSADLAEFQVIAINPHQRRSALPGNQYASMKIGARRLPSGRLEVFKEYLAPRPEELLALGAPLYKPVSAALCLWNALPGCFRKLTPMGIATEVGTKIAMTVADRAFGAQMTEIVLDRHSHLFDERFFPNLRSSVLRAGAK
jgi:hypothetical protein